MRPLTEEAIWGRVVAHSHRLKGQSISGLFGDDARRFQGFSRRFDGLLLDFSKNRIDHPALADLLALAAARDVPGWRDAMFDGGAVNPTEKRAALHSALRSARMARRAGVAEAVGEALTRARRYAEDVRQGRVTGVTGETFTDVVHIGIGGSDLGPRLLDDVVGPAATNGPRLHFLSGVDTEERAAVLHGLCPERTLVIVVTKSGGTRETLRNAAAVADWFGEGVERRAVLERHFVAVTANPGRLASAGLDCGGCFPLWDWVGGRYSLWSAVSLAVMIGAGPDAFEAFLGGGAAIDAHFSEAPLAENLPVLLALVNVWNSTALGACSQAVLPYDWRLRRLPEYLQQLVMESNGKGVDRDGNPLPVDTSPVLWGRSGIDGQHAFYQCLHQGTRVVPADFLCAVEGGDAGDRRELLVNCLAQSRALMRGVDAEELEGDPALAPHRAHPGNRPSNTLLFWRLDGRALGQLLALYEHRVFVEAVIWGINPFDQWGVELGKRLAGDLEGALETGAEGWDPSTAGLVAFARGASGE
ncbi:glucose-6-phosphate isomerase [Arhodomonas sp. SL1]|uniref:glucose-6-phosphate isomerase n=1 Tax=Arhodomonas sp. SL1 TaxID=3425691 RepID=UPI003F88277E